MDLHQLFVFTKVVEHKSFSKAAEDIFLSQSTVSSHIKALERTLNMRLFDRVGREIILTPYGSRLYQWALKLLFLKDEAMLDLKEGMNELKGMIRVAASSVPGQFILPKMIKDFRDQYANVVFQIEQSSSKVVIDKVLNGTVDVGLLGGKFENDKLCYSRLFKEKLVLITSNQTKIKGPVTIQELVKYPFIMRKSGSGTHAMVEKLLKKKKISKEQMNIIAYTESGQTLIQFVMADIGIAIISEIAAKEYAKKQLLKMHEIDGFDDERYFYLVYNKYKTLSLLSRLFIENVK
ncbi:selenium metabolism-associated LysR family transcriptional regulator [Bacillus sp. UNC438CL73TsuS30]|uniref:selenium metabolism-associated LysR family transcriptional regulator n=1 Tax=Bacillus sp. UNC438CL73TsuS30 TaxID=1340434 RepID=UPI00047913E0|nr:selenium metabolism-associated LysR family transcriptional regulator [Bacillus sp. UNC438CL73TsuS30]